jgi:hypothetical protein
MELFCYKMAHSRIGRVISRVVDASLPDRSTVYCKTTGLLMERLKSRFHSKPLAIVIMTSEEDLLDIFMNHHLLRKAFTILVLPDRQRDTTAVGMRIGADLLFYPDSDPVTVEKRVSATIRDICERTVPHNLDRYHNAA